ncbi:MAG: T9SS type A sorting domain-containing protein [Bacteroidales bacterium]
MSYKKTIFMYLYLVPVILVLFSNFKLQSQTTCLKGKVIEDGSLEAIAFANVLIMDNNKVITSSSTDIDGNYIIKFKSACIVDIKVSYVGYEKVIVKAVKIISGDTNIQNIKLKAKSVTLQEISIVEYKTPLISRDQCYSAVAIKSSNITRVDRDVISENKKNINFEINKPGKLTASMLNDFSKWELWQDIKKNELKQFQEVWKISPQLRYAVQVRGNKEMAVVDAVVLLKNAEGNTIWSARTDNTGKAELWLNMFEDSKIQNMQLVVIYENKTYNYENPGLFKNGINAFKIPVDCDIPNQIDIAFVVDATSSMDDEIAFLQSDLVDIIQNTKSNFPGNTIHLGSIFYRCYGNSYVTKTSILSSNIEKTVNFIKNQYSGEGGDEVVEEAFRVSIDSLQWNPSARARLLFFVMDEQPLTNADVIKKMQIYTQKAAEKGIKVIPVIASAETFSHASSLEYLMRSIALATNGTYVFLTDHSNIGDKHAKPTTDQYDVELLNSLLKKIIYQFSYVPECNAKIYSKEVSDTTYISNNTIVAHVVIDTSRKIQQNPPKTNLKVFPSYKNPDSSNNKNITNTLKQIDYTDNKENRTFKNKEIKFYPNPTSGKITVEIEGKINEIFLFDIAGKLMAKFNSKNESSIEIDLSNYSTGIYFLKFNDNLQWFTGKIILNH